MAELPISLALTSVTGIQKSLARRGCNFSKSWLLCMEVLHDWKSCAKFKISWRRCARGWTLGNRADSRWRDLFARNKDSSSNEMEVPCME